MNMIAIQITLSFTHYELFRSLHEAENTCVFTLSVRHDMNRIMCMQRVCAVASVCMCAFVHVYASL